MLCYNKICSFCGKRFFLHIKFLLLLSDEENIRGLIVGFAGDGGINLRITKKNIFTAQYL